MFVFIDFFSKFEPTVATCSVDSSTGFKLQEIELNVIKDIYKCPLKLYHFGHLIDRSRYFIDFDLMVSKGKKYSYLVKFHFNFINTGI